MGGKRATVGLLAAALAASACSAGDDDTGDAAAVATDPTTTVPDVSADAVTPPATQSPPADAADDGDATELAAAAEPVATRCDPAAADEAGAFTVRVWHGLGGDVEQLLQVIVGRFEADHPGVRILFERASTDYPAAIDQLRETPEDQLPDVILGSNQTVRLQADSGRFLPIVECSGGELPDQFTDLLPNIERTYTVDGVLWGAPFNSSAPVMLYDRARWRRAGLDPDDPPSDFTELVTAIRTLTDSGEAAAGALLYDRSAMWFLEQSAVQSDRLLIEPANGRAGLDVEATRFLTDDAVEVLTTLQELRRDGYVEWLGVNPSGQDDLARMVHATEPGGITFNSSAVLGDVDRLLGSGGFPDVELGVAPFPGPGQGSIVGGGAWWILDHGDPARAGAAWNLVDWLTQPALIAEIAAFTGYVPTTRRAAEDPLVQERWVEDPGFRVAYDQLLAAPDSDAGAGIQVGPMVEVLRNLELAAAYSIDAGSDPATELARAEEASLDIIQVYADTFADE